GGRSVRPGTHRRTVVADVAIPPELMETASSPSEVGVAASSLAWIDQPCGGGAPATAISPPRLTSTPPSFEIALSAAVAARSEASALAVAPRSSSTPRGTMTVLVAGLNWTACQPG